MKHLLCLAVAGAALSAPASASDFDVRLESGGSSAITVAPGAAVSYQAVGELTDTLNEGLAFFCFDLAFDGGPLAQAAAPVAGSMLQFASPLGINNPAGFGGTQVAGDLVQVGGAQNTINQSFAPQPSGGVATGVGQLGSPEVLVSGGLVAPDQVGTYTLGLSNLRANAIRQGETGTPFWAVDEAPVGTLTKLVVEVSALSQSMNQYSLSAGTPVSFALEAGAARAGRLYLLMGSASGTSPGLPVAPGVTLPLNFDGYLSFSVTYANLTPFTNSFGILDGAGQATAGWALPAGWDPSLAGAQFSHAYVTLAPLDFASEAETLTLIP